MNSMIAVGVILLAIGASISFLAKLFLRGFMPKHANDEGILVVKLFGFTIAVIGALMVFFSGINEFRQ